MLFARFLATQRQMLFQFQLINVRKFMSKKFYDIDPGLKVTVAKSFLHPGGNKVNNLTLFTISKLISFLRLNKGLKL